MLQLIGHHGLYEFVFIAKELVVFVCDMVVTYVASICTALLTLNS